MAANSQSSRWLAPVALLLAALITVIIIASSGGSVGSASGGSPAPSSVAAPQAKTSGPTFYIVKSGDTLSAISVSAGVPISTIQALNPGLDTQALQPGQRLRLRQ
jgi:LysM repeat protein